MATLELFGTARCPHTQDMRDWLEWRGCDFIEYDVEADPSARHRMRDLSGGQRTVPVLAEDGKIVQVGWQGHGCIVERIKDGQRLLHSSSRSGPGRRLSPVRVSSCSREYARWMGLNGEEGVEIYLEGCRARV